MVSVQFLPEDKAGLLSTVLESLLYGFSLLMFIATLVILLRGQTWAQVNKPMVVVACCLFILSTIHLAVDINRLNIGLILDRDGYPGGPAAFFANPSENTFVFKNAVYSFQTVLGDGVVIYRCYKVWKSVWVIIFPCLLWIGVAITAAGSVYSCTRPSSTDTSDIFVKELGQWITSFYSMTFSCNLVATILLASRLYMIHRGVRNSRVGNGRTMGILLIIVDAGALYSMTLLAALITFALKTNGQYVVLDMVTPIISIAFYMVIVRVGIARHNNSRSNTSNNQTAPRVPMSRQENSGGRLGSKPMHVRIQVEQETESGRRSPEKGEDPNDLPMEPYHAV
ncbi:hypothetical protein MSAN_01264100 [Mycena sanguinolenta]|uniref:Uncharacterized protein n=1 Tax=Mycena sanguinolenta TaxID=230812 RepID=A0A8H6YDR4_9AGAR|nr:hypothetical protein MSAN_01264100 [Mycena sanguinolenta]